MIADDIGQRIAKLASFAANAKVVDNYEAIRRFRAFVLRCEIAAAWQKELEALENGPELDKLPGQLVGQSRMQLDQLQAQIKAAIAEAKL